MTKFTISLAVALVSVTCLATSSYANEKYHHMQAKPGAAQAVPHAAPTPTPGAVPATQPLVAAKPAAAPVPATPTHVVAPVNEHAPLKEVNFANFTKPDTKLADQIIESFNKKDLALFEKALVKTGYTVITPFDSEVNNDAMMKNFWQEMFGDRGCLKSVNFSGTHGEIQAPYPGIATLNTKLKFINDGKETLGLMNIMMKYEADGWKIASIHLSSYDLVKHMASKEAKRVVEQEFAHRQSKQMGLFLPFVFGLVIGSATMFAYSKRKKKEQRK